MNDLDVIADDISFGIPQESASDAIADAIVELLKDALLQRDEQIAELQRRVARLEAKP